MQIVIEYTDKGLTMNVKGGPPELVVAVLEMAKHGHISKILQPHESKSGIVVAGPALVK